MSEPTSNQTKNTNKYLKYSGMAFQLLVLMLTAAYLGKWIDQKLNLENPWFTLGLILLFFFSWFYRLYKDVTSDQ